MTTQLIVVAPSQAPDQHLLDIRTGAPVKGTPLRGWQTAMPLDQIRQTARDPNEALAVTGPLAKWLGARDTLTPAEYADAAARLAERCPAAPEPVRTVLAHLSTLFAFAARLEGAVIILA